MRISSLVILTIVIGSLFLGMFTFVNGIAGSGGYNLAVNSSSLAQFNQTTEVINDISNNYNNIMNWSVDKTLYLALVPEAIILVKNVIFLPLSVLNTMLYAIFDILMIPSWAEGMIIAIIMVVIIFSLIAIILRYKDT